MPFDSLESLLSSDFSLIVKKGGNSQATFTAAQPDSIFDQLNRAKVKEFLPTDQGLDKINASQNNLAFYYALESILDFTEYKCQVLRVK